jgi:hypothetical protein
MNFPINQEVFMDWKVIHQQAVQIVQRVKTSECELIDVLQVIESEKIYQHFGLTSLYGYCIDILKLSEDRACVFIKIARKSVEVPELKAALRQNEMTLTNAGKIASILTTDNKERWLSEAKSQSSRELERSLCREFPKERVKDRLQPLTGELSELDCSLSREAEALLRRVQDLLSQKFGKSATFDDCVKSMAKEFIWRHDPVERAERLHLKVQAPGALRVTVKNGKRTSVPQSEVHQLFHRTKGQCTFVDKLGKRCPNRRWVQRHHLREVSCGGTHDGGNLTLLCSSHHRLIHAKFA